MAAFLIFLLVLAMVATVIALSRGVITFAKTTEADVTGEGPNLNGQRQNKLMQARIGFQALAIIIVILFLLMARGG
ncbi:Hypoxia induced protein conserved region [Sphingomonas laterariae]|uniref:Hypoxia induced protein conserved region n=1 Tax=Edaphosphingomonas laterariae TaxID=861865 RepID=A0A239F4I7_9SPHN|nr:twin transmembrane helix small protein [Sphingomonas laterariae]SNS51641.1 Hypoxia induced protein conserved region [Sphingomonas laterariae]